MGNIFEIQQNLQSIFNTIEENEGEISDELMSELAIKQDELKLKIKNYSEYIKVLESDIKLIKEEKDRLTSLQKSKEDIIKRLQKIMIEAIENFGDTSKSGSKFIDYGTGKASIRTSKVIEIDEDSINLFANKYINALNAYAMQNQLDQGIVSPEDLIEFANEQCHQEDDLFIAFGKDSLDKINLNIDFSSSIKDAITSKEGFELFKALIAYNNFKMKVSADKTTIKNEYKTTNTYPIFADIKDNKTIQFK